MLDWALGRGGAEPQAWKAPEPQAKAPAEGRAQKDLVSGLALGVIPGHARNVAAGDADVGQFTVAEPIQLAKALVVAAPLPIDADQMRQEHGR